MRVCLFFIINSLGNNVGKTSITRRHLTNLKCSTFNIVLNRIKVFHFLKQYYPAVSLSFFPPPLEFPLTFKEVIPEPKTKLRSFPDLANLHRSSEITAAIIDAQSFLIKTNPTRHTNEYAAAFTNIHTHNISSKNMTGIRMKNRLRRCVSESWENASLHTYIHVGGKIYGQIWSTFAIH